MLKLEFQTTLRLEQNQEIPFLQSVFPYVEKVLSISKNQESLRFVGFRNSGEYRSILDCFLCSVLWKYRKPCLRFYEGKGQALRETETQETIDAIERILLCALEIASAKLEKEDRMKWEFFREKIIRIQQGKNNIIAKKILLPPRL